MSTDVLTADAAAGEANLPVRKRKTANFFGEVEAKIPKTEDVASAAGGSEDDDDDLKPLNRAPMSKAREIRLEQNRKAARESRRRKKNMIEELQRSVIFFSRANSTLKQQNDELTRHLVQAQTQVAAIESGQQPAPVTTQFERQQAVAQVQGDQQQQLAEAVAQQAVYETQGFPSAAARTAAQTMSAGGSETASGNASAGTSQQLPAMQTGATMQAMANFQQAAAVSNCYLKDGIV
jgi:hypothetical protein